MRSRGDHFIVQDEDQRRSGDAHLLEPPRHGFERRCLVPLTVDDQMHAHPPDQKKTRQVVHQARISLASLRRHYPDQVQRVLSQPAPVGASTPASRYMLIGPTVFVNPPGVVWSYPHKTGHPDAAIKDLLSAKGVLGKNGVNFSYHRSLPSLPYPAHPCFS